MKSIAAPVILIMLLPAAVLLMMAEDFGGSSLPSTGGPRLVKSAAADETLPDNPAEPETATLTITAANADGPARGTVELYAVKPGEENPVLVTTRPLVRGAATIELPPGTYTAVVAPAEEIIKEPRTVGDIVLAAGDLASREVYFARGKVSVTAACMDGGKAGGVITLENYNREEDQYAPIPGNVLVVEGKASFHLPPGEYRLRFVPDGIIGAAARTSPVITVEDKAGADFKPVVEYGTLKVASSVSGSAVKSHLTISRVEGEGAAPRSAAYSHDFDGAAIALKAAPGKYSVAVAPDHRALLGAEPKTFDGVEIQSGGTSEISANFEKGRVALTVSAFDEVAGRVDFQQWHPAQQNYSTFDAAELKGGLNEFFLAPGRYRIVVLDTLTTPEAEYAWTDIEITDKCDLSRSFRLEHGRISIAAVSNGKPAEGRIAIEIKGGEGGARRGAAAVLKDGRALVEVRPGSYRLIYIVDGAQEAATEWFEVKERAWLTRVFDVGPAGGDAPPEADLWGPHEVGDEDAVLEAGERITFSTRFGGEFAGAKITLSMPGEDGKAVEKEIAEIAKAGEDKDREVALERAGEYRLRIVAWSAGEPRMETVIERVFIVRPRHEEQPPAP